MIKFLRGTTENWRTGKGSNVVLEPGQPGFDKAKNKLKIGNGQDKWKDLPYTSGLHAEEILCSESDAKKQDSNDKFAINIITYGTETPNENTVGQIYLQQIDEPEVDYIVASGTNGIWTYQKWKSGIAKCWGNYSFIATVQEPLELFYQSLPIYTNYPFTFKEIPTETATIQSSGGQQVMLANTGANTIKNTGSYTIISLGTSLDAATYCISMHVEGFWR
jgi:hypothetical protein